VRYFAYGTNMNADIMARKELSYNVRQAATLDGYGLRFNKRSLRALLPDLIGFANIVVAAEEKVEGVLYEMSDQLLDRLDTLERHPEHYQRIEVTVQTNEGPLACYTYHAQPDKIAEGLIPSRNYINHMLAVCDLLSPTYRDRLDRLETYAGECAACHQVTKLLFHKEAERMFVLCAPCLEAKGIWGDTLGRPFTVLDTEAVMGHLRKTGRAYQSIPELIADVVDLGLVEPLAHEAEKCARPPR
jgi:gamma-glutamylcyclotransferase